MTKDGRIIVCHDPCLKRMCGDTRKVIETYLKDLPAFKQKIPMHFSALDKNGEFLTTYDMKP